MNPYPLVYLTIGALLNIIALIIFRKTRQDALAYLLYHPASHDSFVVGIEFLGRLLVSIVICASVIMFWPLVWAALGIGTWRLRKE